MAKPVYTGNLELDQALASFSGAAGWRIYKSTLRAGLTVANRSVKKAVPVVKEGGLLGSVGRSFKVFKGLNRIIAKTGINVGEAGKRGSAVKSRGALHYVAPKNVRYRKRIGGKFAGVTNRTLLGITIGKNKLTTGKGQPHDFVVPAVQAASLQIHEAMEKACNKAILREASKLLKISGPSKGLSFSTP